MLVKNSNKGDDTINFIPYFSPMKIIIPFRLLACLLFVAYILTGCSPDRSVNTDVQKAENEFAANYIYKLFCGDSSYCLANVTQTIKDTAKEKIVASCIFLKPLQYESSQLISVIHQKDEGMFLRYEYGMKGYYIYFELGVARVNNDFAINSFKAYMLTKQRSAVHFFVSDHILGVRYFILVCGALLWLFQIFTVIIIAKSRLARPVKFFWISLAALSIGRITVSWTTGIIATHFPAFSFTDLLLVRQNGQWLLLMYVPVFTIIFWANRKKILTGRTKGSEADEQIAESYRRLEQEKVAGQEELD
ncbi:MAG: hypothetical protein JSS96_11445 [Bacteroidetes bacterium]|nr:hypothetical protein [Bacteroidota bacterium]